MMIPTHFDSPKRQTDRQTNTETEKQRKRHRDE